MKKSIVIAVVTSYFPNSNSPQRAIFVKNLLEHMQGVQVTQVISPVPWVPRWLPGAKWKALQGTKRESNIGNLNAIYPRYVVLPKLEFLSGLTYALSIFRYLWRLKKLHPQLVIHAHCAYPDGVGVAWAASILRLPFVITAHGSDINVYARKKLIGGQVANALRAAAAVIGVSKPLIEKMQGLTRLPFNRFNEIPCAGFDPLVFIPREREYARKYLTMPIAGRVLLFVGNLVPIKGIPIILEAWALLKKDKIITDDDRVVLVGIGTQREMLTKQAIIKDIAASTLFIGGQMHERIPYWLNAANALVLASYNEGTPNVIIEALACGIPVIATAVGGVPYLLEGTGLPLVHPGDAQALADAIQKAFSQPWDARALQARVQDYTWSALAEKNVELLRDVAERMYG